MALLPPPCLCPGPINHPSGQQEVSDFSCVCMRGWKQGERFFPPPWPTLAACCPLNQSQLWSSCGSQKISPLVGKSKAWLQPLCTAGARILLLPDSGPALRKPAQHGVLWSWCSYRISVPNPESTSLGNCSVIIKFSPVLGDLILQMGKFFESFKSSLKPPIMGWIVSPKKDISVS